MTLLRTRLFSHRPGSALLAGVVAAAAVFAAPAPSAHAQDDYVSRANALYAGVPAAKRSDLVMLPLIAKMDAPPAALTTAYDAALLPATSGAWGAIAAWAEAPAQRAVLDALAQVTEDEGSTSHMVFAQPYGVEGVPVDLVMAELYTDLGDPPSLAAADLGYLKGLDKVAKLAHAEANRLMAAGEGIDAVETMVQWLFFSRQIASREMQAEKLWGMQAMALAMEHMRDLAYRDFRSDSRSMTAPDLVEIVRRLDDRSGPLGIERLRLPRADQIAVGQLLNQIYDPRSRRPREDRYSGTMARIAAQDRPLRLFSESARWEMARAQAAGWHEVNDALSNVARDYEYRWGLNQRDPAMATATDFERTVKKNPGMAPIRLRYDGYDNLFKLRQVLRTEAAGTRMSLAMYAYFLRHNQIPRALSAVRPNFAPAMDRDPYSLSGNDLEFFVPIRDQPRGPRGETQPHQVRVFPGSGRPNFAVPLHDDQFIIYSVGPDDDRGWARTVTQASEEFKSGDYLLWPPAMSLLRTHMTQQGRFR